MGLSRLEINNVRNLQFVKIDPLPGINGLYGLNGSGKTSVLEAIHILGRGNSFRNKDLNRVLQNGASQFLVSGKLSETDIAIGVYHQPQATQIRIAGQPIQGRMELASQLPLLFIGPDSHALISEGPRQRRRFLDWGVFHVEPRFLPAWRRYQRALKQRNKALGVAGVETAWDQELAQAGEEITQLRHMYLTRIEGYIDQYVRRLVELDKINLSFSCGWRQDSDLITALKTALPQDREYGFTRHGPHRADILLKVGSYPARETVSRGQQKLLVIAMLLAQVALLNEVTALRPVILVDDVAAELDVRHRQHLLEVLAELKAQVFMTVTERQALPMSGEVPIRWFHVEQGKVTPD